MTSFEVFFDGECPLCRREISVLRKLDRDGRIRFTDLAAPDFDEKTVGLSRAELMARIRGRLPDGTLVDGVEVFRHLYETLGFRRLSALSRLPGISTALEAGYGWFARNRLRITGRCADDVCGADPASPGSALKGAQ